MAATRLTTVLHHLHLFAAAGPLHDLSDGQLLRGFAQTHDDKAFETLVRRHGPLVHGVCQRILGPGPDLDDVVQATFLVLARKAGSIRQHASTASWLHGTARRLALRLKYQRHRRQRRERSLSGLPDMVPLTNAAVDPVTCASLRELGRIVDEEVERLPARQRDVLVLCHLEGLSNTEAAARLDCPVTTLKSRLVKARTVLQQRLQRRGVTLSVTALIVIGAEQAAHAALPVPLLRATVNGAAAYAAKGAAPAVCPRAALLADQALRTAPAVRLPLALAAVLTLTLLGVAWALQPGAVPAAADADPLVVPVVAAQQPAAAKDLHGDPLPAGAVARLGTVRWRHGGLTGFVAFAPDGKSVVSASDDQVFHVWEFPSGKEVRRFGPGADQPLAPPARMSRSELPVALSPDGKVLACNFDGGDILLYDVATAKLLGTLPPPPSQGFLNNVAFSPDGRHLAVRDMVGRVQIWDWAQAKKIQAVDVLHAIVIGEAPPLTYSPDGKWLAMTVNQFDDNVNRLNANVKLVELLKGPTIHTIKVEPKTYVLGVLFSPDSKLLVYADGDGGVHLVETATGKEVRRIQGQQRDWWTLAFSKDGQTLLARSVRQQNVREWEVSSGKELRSLGTVGKLVPASNRSRLPASALSPDGNTLAFAGIDHALHFLDLTVGNQVHSAGGNTMSLTALGWQPDGKRLWTQGYDKALRQWDGTSGKELQPMVLPVNVYRTTVSPNARFLAVGPWWDKSGTIFDIGTGKKVGQLPQRQQPDKDGVAPTSMVFSADGATLAVRWEHQEKIELFAMPAGKLQHSLDITGAKHAMAVNGLACWPTMFFAADGQLLAAHSEPGVLSLWDTATGRKRTSLAVQGTTPVTGGAFTPDGRCLALEKSDGSVVLWEVAAGQARRLFVPKMAPPKGPGASVPEGVSFEPTAAAPAANVAFAPAGNVLAHAGPDCVVRLWDVRTGQELVAFHGHSGTINALAFTTDGKTLASASSDTTVLIWDLSTALAKPPLRPLTAAELQVRWELLNSADAQLAFRAMTDLLASPAEAVALLSQHLQPAAALDPEVVRKLLGQLDDPVLKVRQKAVAVLLKLDGQVLPALEKALAAKPPLEVKIRLEKIRDGLTSLVLAEESLRLYRAVEVLEGIGTPQARQLLERLADGAPGALTTTAARQALRRAG